MWVEGEICVQNVSKIPRKYTDIFTQLLFVPDKEERGFI